MLFAFNNDCDCMMQLQWHTGNHYISGWRDLRRAAVLRKLC